MIKKPGRQLPKSFKSYMFDRLFGVSQERSVMEQLFKELFQTRDSSAIILIFIITFSEDKQTTRETLIA